MKILLVEDDKKIGSYVKKGLKEQGMTVEWVENGDEGLHLALHHAYDVLVLDIMLPGRDGLSIVRQIREQKITAPVILVTARSAINERVEGLNQGADDYIAKPFYLEELIARIHAVSRRTGDDQLSMLEAGDVCLNLLSREVLINGTTDAELTRREFSLLELLMRAPGRVFSRTEILERVWDYDFDPQTNVVDVTIRRVRKKIQEAEGDDALIETVRGVGYRIRKDT